MFIISKPEIDSLIKEYADVFKGVGKFEGEHHMTYQITCTRTQKQLFIQPEKYPSQYRLN